MHKLLFVLLGFIPLFSMAQNQVDSSTNEPAEQTVRRPEARIANSRYKSTVVSMPYRYVRDEGHSPLFHRGPSLQIAAYNERWRTKKGYLFSDKYTHYTKFEMVLGLGYLKTNKNNVNAVTGAPILNMEINYHYMRFIKKILNERIDWYLGGIFTNTFDGRLYTFLPNNSFGYEFSNVLNPATHFAYDFNKGRHLRHYQAGFKLNFALLAHVIRPNYIGMEPPQTYMGEDINSLAIFTHGNTIALPNRFIRVNTELYLDRFNFSNNNKFRLFYGWGLHITKLTNSNPLYSIYHSIGVVTMIHAEKKQKRKIIK